MRFDAPTPTADAVPLLTAAALRVVTTGGSASHHLDTVEVGATRVAPTSVSHRGATQHHPMGLLPQQLPSVHMKHLELIQHFNAAYARVRPSSVDTLWPMNCGLPQSTVHGHSARMHATCRTSNTAASCVNSGEIMCAGISHKCSATASGRSTRYRNHGRQCVTPPLHRGSWPTRVAPTSVSQRGATQHGGSRCFVCFGAYKTHAVHAILNSQCSICTTSATECGGCIVADELWTAAIHGSWTLAHACRKTTA